MTLRKVGISVRLPLLVCAMGALLGGGSAFFSFAPPTCTADPARTEPEQNEGSNLQPAAQNPVTLPPTLVVGTNDTGQAEAQRSPLAVTPLDVKELQRAGITSTVELGRAVPNLSQSHGGLRSYSDTYAVRGLGNTEFLSDPAVVLYVDDAPFGDVSSYTTDLLAVDQVAVYRGPQGTRFGKNSEGGVINILTRQPGNQLEAEAQASIGSFDTQQYQVLAMGPLAKDKLYFSLAGQYERSDGFIDNTFLHTHADEQAGLNGRAALKWTPTDNWSVDFTATGDKFDEGIGLVPLSGPRRTTTSDFDGNLTERVNSQALRVRGEFSGLALLLVTTRHDFDLNPVRFDIDFSPARGNTGTVQRLEIDWSQEVRVKPIEPGEHWNWQAGFFFSREDNHTTDRGDFFIPALGLSAVDVTTFTAQSDNYALFADCTRNMGEKLDLTLGLRLDETVRDLDRTHVATFSSAPPLHATGEFYNAAPKLTLAFHPSQTILFYGSSGLGFKAGGFSPLIDPPTSPKFSTETAWANEVGAKATGLDGRVSARATVFYNDVTDYQVEQFAPNSFEVTIINAAHAYTLGAELEVTGRPGSGWQFAGFFGYTDARLQRFTDPFAGITVQNTHPPFVAEFNAGISAEYKHSSGLLGRLEYTAVGDTFYDAANSARLKQAAYGLLRARAGFERRQWGIFLFGENLTDRDYFTKKIPPLNAGAPGQPQTFGLMAVVRY